MEPKTLTAKCPICGRENPPESVDVGYESRTIGKQDVRVSASYVCLARAGEKQQCETEYSIKLRGKTASDFLKDKQERKEDTNA